MSAPHYTTQLQAGLGRVDETRTLLELWQPGQTGPDLYRAALQSGRFPEVTARRLSNFVAECFAPRYLGQPNPPAKHLKRLAGVLPLAEFSQLLLLHTARATPILADFIRQVYWPRYAAGQTELANEDARAFVRKAVDDGRTNKPWSEGTIQNVAGYLTGVCADYGMLEPGVRKVRTYRPFRISPTMATYLSHDLHFAGLGDNALLTHEDWALFGLQRDEVLEEIKRLSKSGALILQAAGEVVRIGWKYPDMEALCDVLAQG